MAQPQIATVRKLAQQPGKWPLDRNLRLDVERRADGQLRQRYVFTYWIAGKGREKTIGDYAKLTLTEAVNEADRLRALVRLGVDPIQQEQQAREINQTPKPKQTTFAEVADHYATAHRADWRDSTWGHWLVFRDKHMQLLLDLPIAEIERPTILSHLETFWTCEPPMIPTGLRCRVHLEHIFDHAALWGWYPAEKRNPANWGKRSPFAKRPDHEHFPTVAWERIPIVFRALSVKAHGVMGYAEPLVQFNIAMACRPSEGAGLPFKELDLDNGLWTLPAERDKEGQQRITPLTRPAVDAIERALAARGGRWAKRGPDALVFPSGRPDNQTGIQRRDALNECLRRYVSKEDADATMHGTSRGGFKTWSRDSDTPCDQFWVELCLGHRLEKNEAAYYRGNGLARRTEVFEAWGRHLTGSPASN